MRVAIFLFLLLLWTGRAAAHDPGLSTATLRWQPDHLEVTLVYSITDAARCTEFFSLSRDAGVDEGQGEGNSFGRNKSTSSPWPSPPYKSWRRGNERHVAGLPEATSQALAVKFDDQPAQPVKAQWNFDDRNNASLSLVFDHGPSSKLFVQSRWLADLPPGHRQLLSLKNSNGKVLAEQWLSAGSNSATLQIAEPGSKPERGTIAHSFLNFLGLGVKHIWTGYDHLLFLFGLLIATRRLVASLKVITCFTLAHSITLAVATLSHVEFAGHIVEPLIAASIVYVGIENLARRGDPARRGLLTFAFGLIHGFGFASVLRELGIGAMPGGVALPLFSFNLGVELGQIAVAAVLLPLLWKLSAKPAFATRWMPAGSVMVALLGGYWLVERLWL